MTEQGRYLETKFNLDTEEICIIVETDEYIVKTTLEPKELDDLIKVLKFMGKV